jgi:hypothetical protein
MGDQSNIRLLEFSHKSSAIFSGVEVIQYLVRIGRGTVAPAYVLWVAGIWPLHWGVNDTGIDRIEVNVS